MWKLIDIDAPLINLNKEIETEEYHDAPTNQNCSMIPSTLYIVRTYPVTVFKCEYWTYNFTGSSGYMCTHMRREFAGEI